MKVSDLGFFLLSIVLSVSLRNLDFRGLNPLSGWYRAHLLGYGKPP